MANPPQIQPMMPNSAAHERLHALDGLRAVMMLLGIVLHTASSYMVLDLGAAWPYKDTETTVAADLTAGVIHVFRMPVFFVLAGFFAALLHLRRGPVGMLSNRFQRIGLPLIVGVVLLYPLVASGFIFSGAAKTTTLTNALGNLGQAAQTSTLYIPDSTMHLWFIYDLLYFYLAAVVIRAACVQLPEGFRVLFQRSFSALTQRPMARIIVLGLISAVTLLPTRGLLTPSASFLPNLSELMAYGFFFGFGWILYGHRHLLADFTAYAWPYSLLAPFIWMAGEAVAAGLPGSAAESIARSLGGGLAAWLLFFGLTGVFLRYFDRPSARIRYLVDASYWVYLVHLPIVIWIPGFLVGTSLSVWSRMLIVLTGTSVLGFVTYDLFVRSTFIGRVLNGRRYARGLPKRSGIPVNKAGATTQNR